MRRFAIDSVGGSICFVALGYASVGAAVWALTKVHPGYNSLILYLAPGNIILKFAMTMLWQKRNRELVVAEKAILIVLLPTIFSGFPLVTMDLPLEGFLLWSLYWVGLVSIEVHRISSKS